MSKLNIEMHITDAEAMFSHLANMTVDHENYEFIVVEVQNELTKAESTLRGNKFSADITSNERALFESRIMNVRGKLLEHVQKVKQYKERDRYGISSFRFGTAKRKE